MESKLFADNHFHFIGIGGIGMSAIAMALLKKGFSVSGSDLIQNDQILLLKKMGAPIFIFQESKNIDIVKRTYPDKELVIVISSAIRKDNKELSYSNKKNLTIKHRSEILSFVMNTYNSIGVAGSHGKTSTSTFLTTLLDACTKNTSSIIGGIQPIYNSNSYIENTTYIVAEIDESDGSTCNYQSDLGIITNIDFDHCDYYSDISEVIKTFKDFASNSKTILINHDCKNSRENISSCLRWSLSEINNIEYSMIPKELNSSFTIADYYEKGNFMDTCVIPIPGLHNLSNITAAISACRLSKVSYEQIKKNIRNLKLPKRRFEIKGKYNDRQIIDDYAHHPNEIKETIKLARLFIKNNYKRLVVIFQPHRFSRVEMFLNEFAIELSKADFVVVTNIYGAGEINKNKINSSIITDKIYQINKNVIRLKDNNEVKQNFNEIKNSNDLILNIGAGDCNNLWNLLTNNFIN